MFKRLVLAALLLSTTMLLPAGCNTVEGLGQDVSAAGEGMSGAAQETKESLENN